MHQSAVCHAVLFLISEFFKYIRMYKPAICDHFIIYFIMHYALLLLFSDPVMHINTYYGEQNTFGTSTECVPNGNVMDVNQISY